jgi:hypothetical protein
MEFRVFFFFLLFFLFFGSAGDGYSPRLGMACVHWDRAFCFWGLNWGWLTWFV